MTETGGIYDAGSSPSLVRLDSKLDILTDQIGRMTEGLTELKILIQQQAQIAQQQAETARQQADTAAQQTQNIDRLTRIIEQLVSRGGQ